MVPLVGLHFISNKFNYPFLKKKSKNRKVIDRDMSTDALLRRNFAEGLNRFFVAVDKATGEVVGTIALFQADEETAKLRR